MKPFYFGDSARPLFGIHHPPDGPRRRWGVLVCNPFGQEALRAHQSLRDLAGRLAAAGFDVLRFDYRGCGDSAGSSETGSMAEWREDIGAALQELGETAGVSRFAVVGLRLGGALAALEAGRRREVEALVLWNPVVDGRAYLQELGDAHRAWMKDHAHRPATGDGEIREVLGFPLTAGLAAELGDLDPSRVEIRAGLRTLVVTTAGDTPPVVGTVEGAASVEHAAFPPAPVWLHAEGMDRVLVPNPLLEHLTGWLDAACR